MAKQDTEIVLTKEDVKVLDDTFKDKTLAEVMNSDDDGGTLEKSVFMLTNKLFSKENLYMISRLDETLAYYMIKHVILKRVFYDYYMNCTLEYKINLITKDKVIIKYVKEKNKKTGKTNKKQVKTIIKINVSPYYEIIPIIKYPKYDLLKGAYNHFINDIMELTISFKGQGREEIRDLIRGLHGELEKKEGGFLQNLFTKK